MEPITRPNGQPYLPRKVGDVYDVELLREARRQEIPVLLAGPPGSGKTACIEAAFGEELVTITCHEETEGSDFTGNWIENEDRSVSFVYGGMIDAMRNGQPYLVDDITLTDPRALAVLYPAMDGRKEVCVTSHRGETVAAEAGFFVVGCHNPGVKGAILTEALSSRFLLQINVETDFDIARKLEVPETVIRIANNMQKKKDEEKITFVPQMREMLGFVKIASSFSETMAVNNMFGLVPELEREIVRNDFGSVFGFDPAPLCFNTKSKK